MVIPQPTQTGLPAPACQRLVRDRLFPSDLDLHLCQRPAPHSPVLLFCSLLPLRLGVASRPRSGQRNIQSPACTLIFCEPDGKVGAEALEQHPWKNSRCTVIGKPEINLCVLGACTRGAFVYQSASADTHLPAHPSDRHRNYQ